MGTLIVLRFAVPWSTKRIGRNHDGVFNLHVHVPELALPLGTGPDSDSDFNRVLGLREEVLSKDWADDLIGGFAGSFSGGGKISLGADNDTLMEVALAPGLLSTVTGF